MWPRNLFILLFVVLLGVLQAGCEKSRLPTPFHASDIGAMFTQADFRLTDHNGKPRTLADFRGKVVVLFFGYTHCPDICPTTLADMALMMRKLEKDADKVQVLFITIDPERDKPELMAKYVPAFYSSFLGLYGDEQATAQAAKAFYVAFLKQPATSGYNMDHSVGAFLVDPQGKVRLHAPQGQSAGWLAEDILLLLAGV